MEPIKAFLRWLEIREENGIPFRNVAQLRADVDHSALLRVLLNDEEVFPEPPPRAFSYPWYELVKTGRAVPFSVNHGPNLVAGPDALVIEQCDEWRILERLGEDQFIASYLIPDTKEIQRIRSHMGPHSKTGLPMKLSASRWKVYKALEGVAFVWIIERLQ